MLKVKMHIITLMIMVSVIGFAQAQIMGSEVMENVYNIEKSQIIPKVYSLLHDVGYGVTARVLDASRMGVPQARRRFFKLCCRNSKRP